MATFENPIIRVGPIISINKDQSINIVEPVSIKLNRLVNPKKIVTKNKIYNTILGFALVLICVVPFSNSITCPKSVEPYFTALVKAG